MRGLPEGGMAAYAVPGCACAPRHEPSSPGELEEIGRALEPGSVLPSGRHHLLALKAAISGARQR
jgi:hypothetical protein